MNWQTITPPSHVITAIAYDPAAQLLGVRMPNGAEYFYIDVPADVHERFMLEKSKGTFYAKFIKPKYQCRNAEGNVAKGSPSRDELHPRVEERIRGKRP